MDELAYVRVMEEVLPFLSPYEQVVYHWLFFLTQAQGHAQISIRYEDLARQCRLSLSAIRRAIKSLTAKTLLKTSWQPKSATTFVVLITPQAPRPRRSLLRASVYDAFRPEDRELFLACKRGLNLQRLHEIEAEARAWLAERGLEEFLEDKVNELILRETFGPARSRQYETLFLHLYRSP